METNYRGYRINFNPPPIPTRFDDWQWSHEDFDGAPDAYDNRCGTSASLEQAKADIDAQIGGE